MDIKEWWDNLSLREKQVMFFGGIIVTLALFYLIIWAPLSNAVASYRHEVEENGKLLAWMKEADHEMQNMQQTAKHKTSASSLLSLVQKQLAIASLTTTQLRQGDNGEIQMSFQNVAFDKLIQWLVAANQNQHLSIVHMSVTPTATPGLVMATITVK